MTTEQTDRHAAEVLDMADLLRPAAVRAAATLRIADHVADGARDAPGLAARIGADPGVTAHLVRYLVALGLLGRADDGTLTLTALGETMRDDGPGGVRAVLATDGVAGHGDVGMVNIVHTVRTGEPAHIGMFGGHFWDTVNSDPAFVDSLRSRATHDLNWDAQMVVDAYDWTAARHVVDVGGHAGALLANLVRRHPHLRGTLVDLPNTAKVAEEKFAEAGLGGRCAVVATSFFEPLPAGGDVYLLSAILADWDDDRATAILRRCAEAAGPDGAVLLAEVNLHPFEDDTDPARAGLDLYIAGMVRTPVRTPEQLAELAGRAGLRVTWTGPANGVRSLVELRAA